MPNMLGKLPNRVKVTKNKFEPNFGPNLGLFGPKMGNFGPKTAISPRILSQSGFMYKVICFIFRVDLAVIKRA